MLWRELQLDQFWSKRLGVSRKGTHWDRVLFVLVAYRLLAPGSEWRLHREWFQHSALADLLNEDAGLAGHWPSSLRSSVSICRSWC